MSVVRLTQRICNEAQSGDKRYDLRDLEIRGLFLRVEKSGLKTWYLNYRTPSPEKHLKNVKIISASLCSLANARKIARKLLYDLYIKGVDPAYALKRLSNERRSVTLKEILKDYKEWLSLHFKSGSVTIRILKLFKKFLDMPISLIDNVQIQNYQAEMYGKVKNATINRRIAALSGLFKWAVRQNIIENIPFKFTKLPQLDSKTVIRFLNDDERKSLMKSLTEREEKLGCDYLLPAVILSINTGVRKGTLLSLKIKDVDFERRQLILRDEIMKAQKSAVIPLNVKAMSAIKNWINFRNEQRIKAGKQLSEDDYIFPAADDKSKRNDIGGTFYRVLQRAGIKNFSWHCLRHDFASRLASSGVSLQIIQKLLCHANIAMTQRYAHLTDKSLTKAVEILD